MRFSIITICYNEEKRIQKTMKSVYSQKFDDYEHIIEDGGSTDRTLERVSNCKAHYLPNQLKVYSEKDEGLYDAMNRAVIRASGDYICFINSGDFLHNENTLKDVAAQMDAFPGMDWYYGSCVVVFPNGDEYIQIPGSIENIRGKNISEKLKKEYLSLIHQSIFSHRRCFHKNMFDTKYFLRAELKWYYKCLLAQKKIKKLNFPVCRYSLGGFSERISSIAVNAREMRNIFEEMQLLTEENRSMLPIEDNNSERYRTIYNQWLGLHHAGFYIADYLKRKGIKRIAVYGYAELGTHLVNELKNTEIEITCLIDQKDRFPYSHIRAIKPDEFEGNVDLIIVTPLMHFGEIKEYFEGRGIKQLISLEEMLEDMWE